VNGLNLDRVEALAEDLLDFTIVSIVGVVSPDENEEIFTHPLR
jgi:hypothetical protein